jgi:hypothetical protein
MSSQATFAEKSAALPAAQSASLRWVVFHTPEDLNDLARQAALNESERTEFLIRDNISIPASS